MPNNFEDITDPQKAERQGEKMGAMIAEGMGVGIDENSMNAITATEGVYVKLETLTKNSAKNAENLAKKQQKRALDNLKNSLELELVTEQEYYTRLKEYRDTHIQQGTDAWFKCTEEIAKYNKKLVDEAAKAEAEYLELMAKLQKEMEEAARKSAELHDGLRQKMILDMTEDGPLTEKRRITIHNANPDGSDIVYNTAKLNSFDEDTKKLKRYRDLLKDLVEGGNVPQGILDRIGDMTVSDGISAMEILKNATPEAQKTFIDSFNLREDLKKQIAEELYPVFYGDELRKAGEECAVSFAEGYLGDNPEESPFAKALEESFGRLPESYYTFGQESAVSFGAGFRAKLEGVMKEANDIVLGTLERLNIQPFINPAPATAVGGTSNVFNTSYTFNASKDTTTVQLATAKNAETLSRLRGGN